MAIEYMTQAGYDKLKKDLADALAQRPIISAAIAEAREKGDLSENAEYDAARDAQGLLEVKIARLKEKVANARVIDESKLSADTVQLLSKVTVENMNAKMKMQFQIVGESEADFSKGLLSASTPIGKALIGHSKGEVVEAKVPNGIMKFKILDISLLYGYHLHPDRQRRDPFLQVRRERGLLRLPGHRSDGQGPHPRDPQARGGRLPLPSGRKDL